MLGAFVSLKRSGKLRGCCGFLGQSVPLAQALVHAARRTANDDHRFPPVRPARAAAPGCRGLAAVESAVVRGAGEARRDAIQIGKHGLQIARGELRGLLLPGVAIDHGLNAEQFLEHVCLKAELPPTAWREDDTVLWTFEGHSIQRRWATCSARRPPAGRRICLSTAAACAGAGRILPHQPAGVS